MLSKLYADLKSYLFTSTPTWHKEKDYFIYKRIRTKNLGKKEL